MLSKGSVQTLFCIFHDQISYAQRITGRGKYEIINELLKKYESAGKTELAVHLRNYQSELLKVETGDKSCLN